MTQTDSIAHEVALALAVLQEHVQTHGPDVPMSEGIPAFTRDLHGIAVEDSAMFLAKTGAIQELGLATTNKDTGEVDLHPILPVLTNACSAMWVHAFQAGALWHAQQRPADG